jgi:hypothetical protein
MDYAAAKAAELVSPLSVADTLTTRMREGARDEDIAPRWMDHAYNPINDGAFIVDGIYYNTAHYVSSVRWETMATQFSIGSIDGGDGVGAWHFLGRVSHLLQDMTSPLHVFAQSHPDYVWPCRFESYWKDSDASLRQILSSIGGPLHSSALDPKASEKLDAFTSQRLTWRFNNSCPNKNSDDVRGWLEVLAWITYSRASFYGEVRFGNSGSSGPATSAVTTETTFSDGTVGSKPNVLNTMFNGNIVWRVNWNDNWYEITDRNGYVFRFMSWTDIDDWAACGQSSSHGGWAYGKQDSSIRVGGSDDDDGGVRVTGRFWFDTRELGKDASGDYNRYCYPNCYPDGSSMTDHLHQYYGNYLYPLTVRYNATLLGLANRRVNVRTGDATKANGFSWSRKDNFGGGSSFNAGSSGADFYFVAKSSVTLTAPASNSEGRAFLRWLRDGSTFSGNGSRTITINDSSLWIPAGGVTYTAEYQPKTRIIRLEGDLTFGDVTVGSSAQRTMTVYNDGNSTLTVTSITCPSGFTASPQALTVSASSSKPVAITFSPTASQVYEGTITVNSDATSGTNNRSCSGNGVMGPTRIIRLEGDLTFGDVTVGTSAQRTMTVYNDGNSTLTVTSITCPSGFTASPQALTVSASSSKPVTITFNPTASQGYEGTITVNSDAISGTNTRSCSGNGVSGPTRIIRLEGDLTFGDVTVGSSAQRTMTVYNDGTSPLSVTSITCPSGFSPSPQALTVSASGSSPVTITFSPTASQGYEGTITVNSDATSGTNTRSCSGTGTPGTGLRSIDIGAPGVDIGPTSGTTTQVGMSGYHVTTNGRDTWDTADGARFVYESRSGDFDAIVQVVSLSNLGTTSADKGFYAKAGLMVRESLSPDSRQFYIFGNPSAGNNWIGVHERLDTGGPTISPFAGISPAAYPNLWLRLVRHNNTLSAFTSLDGSAWTFLGGDTLPLPDSVFLGLAVTAENWGDLTVWASASFGGYSVITSLRAPLYPLARFSSSHQLVVDAGYLADGLYEVLGSINPQGPWVNIGTGGLLKLAGPQTAVPAVTTVGREKFFRIVWRQDLANSERDFSTTQGTRNWWYGYYDGEGGTPYSTTDFSPLPNNLNGAWVIGDRSQYWTLLLPNLAHPNSVETSGGRLGVDHWAVRRWVSPIAGQIKITLAASKAATQVGDGTDLHVILEGTELATYTVSNGSAVSDDLITAVSVGSRLDFAVAPRGSDIDDTTWTVFRITIP